jgi:hypothetical protein
MAYYPKNRGGGNTYHDHWSETPYGSNSPNGPLLARRHGKGWLDIDATRTRDDVLINDHGFPLRAYFHGDERSKHFPLSWCLQRTYVHNHHVFHLRTIAAAMVDNARHQIGSEVEIKVITPITEATLGVVMRNLAHAAQAAYGTNWRRHMLIKVLTDHPGGLQYALRICRAGHAATIPTMLLPRGRARYMRFKNHHEITYIRGSAVIRR